MIRTAVRQTHLGNEDLLAVRQAGKYLLNVLRYVDIDPEEVSTLSEAADREWPTPWAHDAWCGWHLCRRTLARAGWPTEEIGLDRRSEWRTQGPTRVKTVPEHLASLRHLVDRVPTS